MFHFLKKRTKQCSPRIARRLYLPQGRIHINDMQFSVPLRDCDPITVAIFSFLCDHGVQVKLRWQYMPFSDDGGNIHFGPECIGIYKNGWYRMTLITHGQLSLHGYSWCKSYDINAADSLYLVIFDIRAILAGYQI